MNPQDVLKYGHRTVMRTVEAFPPEQWYTPGACGRWSVKDLVAHLSSFELVLAEALENCLSPGPTPLVDRFAAGGQAFNDEQVDRLRKDWKMEAAMDEYLSAHRRVWAAAGRLAPEVWEQEDIFPWYGAEYDLEDFVVYTFYGHKREHMGQVQVFRDRFV